MQLKRKTRILIISARADFGGGPEHIFKLVKYLLQDFDFYFAVPEDYPYYKRYYDLVGSERIVLIPHRKFRIGTLIVLIKFVRTMHLDIIHSHGKGAGIYSRLIRLCSSKKIIHTFHGWHIGSYTSLQKYLYISLENIFGFVTDRFINVSVSEKDLICKYKVANQDKMVVIENGVEIPETTASVSNFDLVPKKIIAFSRFDYSKNTELIVPILLSLKRLNSLQKFKFIILGSGPGQEKINYLIKQNELSDNIELFGTVTETNQILLNAFCYISTSRWEGMPLGVLEAFAHGLPVIATDVVGNKDAINHDEDGYLFDPDNPNEAAEYLIRLVSDRSLWLKMSRNARNKAEQKYSVTRMALETKFLYNDIMDIQESRN